MSQFIRSAPPSGYVMPIEVEESALAAVLDMLEIEDPERKGAAKTRLVRALEDLQFARSASAKPGSARQDSRALRELAEAIDPERLSALLTAAMDGIEGLKDDNAVLYANLKLKLKWRFSGRQIHNSLSLLQEADDRVWEACRELHEDVTNLSEEIVNDDRRGRPPNPDAIIFARTLRSIWVEFTGRGTSRQTARDRDPFGDFVDAAGKLIEASFAGHYYARQAHEHPPP